VFTVPGYQIDQLIGYGSHAEVWSARLAATGEPVALKRIILHPAGADPAQAGRQAAALARRTRRRLRVGGQASRAALRPFGFAIRLPLQRAASHADGR